MRFATVLVLSLLIAGGSVQCADFEGILQQAKQLDRAGKLNEAIDVCNSVINARPGIAIGPQIHIFLGHLMIKAKYPLGETMAQFARIAEVYPDSPEASQALLRMGYLDDRLQCPTKHWDEIIKRYPNSKEAPEALLRIAYRQEKIGGDSSEIWQRVTRDYPDSRECIEALRCLGQLALRYDDLDAAIGYFARSAQMSAVDIDGAEASRIELGYAYINKYWKNHDTKNLNKAITTFASTLKSPIEERVIRARLGRGEAFLILGLPSLALAEYEAALVQITENDYLKGVTMFEIGVCYDKMEMPTEATSAFTDFLSSIPGTALAAKDDNWKRIRPDFTKLLVHNPDKAYSLTGIDLVGKAACRRAATLQKMGRIEEALALAKEVSSVFPDVGAKIEADTSITGGGNK